MRLYIIVPMYNVENWIRQNLTTLKEQTYKDFHCLLIDDVSTDYTLRTAKDEIADDPRFEIKANMTRKFALRNIFEGISILNPDDEDVLVLIDGDDRLLNSEALSHLMKAYESEDCWLTYGSYVDKHGRLGDNCKKYPNRIIAKNKVHKYPFLGAHPRSFKAKLWRRIRKDSFCAKQSELEAVKKKALLRGDFRSWFHWRDITTEDLHDYSGRFLRRCYDKIILYPMFEMAGNHVKFLEKQLYLYNGSDIPLPYDEDKIHMAKWLTRCIRSIVIAKHTYQPIYL